MRGRRTPTLSTQSSREETFEQQWDKNKDVVAMSGTSNIPLGRLE